MINLVCKAPHRPKNLEEIRDFDFKIAVLEALGSIFDARECSNSLLAKHAKQVIIIDSENPSIILMIQAHALRDYIINPPV